MDGVLWMARRDDIFPDKMRRPTPTSCALLIAALLSLGGCGIIERPDDTGAAASAYAGEERYRFAYSPGPLNCDLRWSVTGTPSTTTCPTCVFAFDVTGTFDAGASDDDGSCFSDSVSFSDTYVLIEEAGVYQLATVQGGQVLPFAEATYDPASGSFTYWYGNLGYSYNGYYYTQYTSGSAQIE